jgi:hypothetical protein
MDCKTARLLLDLTHPASEELDTEEGQALENHLAVCPECSALAGAERQYYQRVGRAMCLVEAPPGLRTKLLSRLDKERGDYYRQQLARGARLAVGLAACVLIALLIWYMRAGKEPAFDVAGLREDVFEKQFSNPTRQKVDEFLSYHQVAAPGEFNYGFLVHYGMIECQGKQVPFLLFMRPEQNLFARVYIVNDKQFDPGSLQAQGRSGSGGYSSEIWRPNGATYAYVIIYTGEDLKPFLVDENRPAT